mmetsp:Transcript_29190/g.97784  ORF Transcript_29190/g.97784 Transcript_29190/m.97784 type:complete len:209 (+) Transcript_29190:104-730(+)
MVRVIPERAAHVVCRDAVAEGVAADRARLGIGALVVLGAEGRVRALGVDRREDRVARRLARDVEAVGVEAGDVHVVVRVVEALRVGPLEPLVRCRKVVEERDPHFVARLHLDGRSAHRQRARVHDDVAAIYVGSEKVRARVLAGFHVELRVVSQQQHLAQRHVDLSHIVTRIGIVGVRDYGLLLGFSVERDDDVLCSLRQRQQLKQAE